MKNEFLFNIKILKGEHAKNYTNVACYSPYYCCGYIRKPSKMIDDYIGYSIDIINHEFMHFILHHQVDVYTSSVYDKIAYDIENRKYITTREIMKTLIYNLNGD